MIFTDISFLNKSGVLDTGFSNHLPVFINKKKEREDKSFETIYGRSYAAYDKLLFQNDIVNHYISDLYWNSTTKNVDLLWDYILFAIVEVVDFHCPMKRMKVRRNSIALTGLEGKLWRKRI